MHMVGTGNGEHASQLSLPPPGNGSNTQEHALSTLVMQEVGCVP